MLRGCDLGDDVHPREGFHFGEPCKSGLAYAFESAGPRARLPYSGAEHAHSARGKRAGCIEGPGARLRTARAGHDKGALRMQRTRIKIGKNRQ